MQKSTQHQALTLENNQRIFTLMPVELWNKVSKFCTPEGLLNLRLASTTFNTLAMNQFYHHYKHKIFRKSAMESDLFTLKKVYNYYEGNKKIQLELFTKKLRMEVWCGSESYNAFALVFHYHSCETPNIMKWLYDMCPIEERDEMVHTDNYYLFINSANSIFGDMKFIYDLSSEEYKIRMIEARNYSAFRQTRFECCRDQIYLWGNANARRRMRELEISGRCWGAISFSVEDEENPEIMTLQAEIMRLDGESVNFIPAIFQLNQQQRNEKLRINAEINLLEKEIGRLKG